MQQSSLLLYYYLLFTIPTALLWYESAIYGSSKDAMIISDQTMLLSVCFLP